jgi:hypothetical protein
MNTTLILALSVALGSSAWARFHGQRKVQRTGWFKPKKPRPMRGISARAGKSGIFVHGYDEQGRTKVERFTFKGKTYSLLVVNNRMKNGKPDVATWVDPKPTGWEIVTMPSVNVMGIVRTSKKTGKPIGYERKVRGRAVPVTSYRMLKRSAELDQALRSFLGQRGYDTSSIAVR